MRNTLCAAMPAAALLCAFIHVPARAQENAAELAGLASAMLRNAEDARQAIARRDKASAVGSVDVALGLAAQIRERAGGQATPLMVTLRSESETETVVVPTRRGKPRKNASVSQVAGRVTREVIDIDMATDRLNAARTDLGAGDFAAAGRSLQAVVQGVQEQTVTGDMPLRRVRENLAMALARVQQGRSGLAQAPLGAAARALGDYTGGHTSEAARLRREIETYARDVEDVHADAIQRINAWSAQVSRWLEENPGR